MLPTVSCYQSEKKKIEHELSGAKNCACHWIGSDLYGFGRNLGGENEQRGPPEVAMGVFRSARPGTAPADGLRIRSRRQIRLDEQRTLASRLGAGEAGNLASGGRRRGAGIALEPVCRINPAFFTVLVLLAAWLGIAKPF